MYSLQVENRLSMAHAVRAIMTVLDKWNDDTT